MRNLFLVFNLLLFVVFYNNSFAQPKIILKLDDIGVKNSVLECRPALDYLLQQKLKASLGVIANRIDATALATMSPYLQATNSKGEKLIEIWHHGLDHIKPEFSGTDYAYQKMHFNAGTELVKKLLGLQMHSFGTPYNASDSTTNKVFLEDPNYKVFIFPSGVSTASGILNLCNRVDMENGTGKPEYAYFVANYNLHKNIYNDYIVLQGHPNKWSDTQLDEFTRIIDFLIAEKCQFVLPYEYYLSLHPAVGSLK